jgi:hypothetical protein
MANVTLFWIIKAFDYVCVKHGLPSIAWNPSNVRIPSEGWWNRWVTLPYKLACKASALLVCHDPVKMAGCLRAARSKLSFGDSAAC